MEREKEIKSFKFSDEVIALLKEIESLELVENYLKEHNIAEAEHGSMVLTYFLVGCPKDEAERCLTSYSKELVKKYISLLLNDTYWCAIEELMAYGANPGYEQQDVLQNSIRCFAIFLQKFESACLFNRDILIDAPGLSEKDKKSGVNFVNYVKEQFFKRIKKYFPDDQQCLQECLICLDIRPEQVLLTPFSAATTISIFDYCADQAKYWYKRYQDRPQYGKELYPEYIAWKSLSIQLIEHYIKLPGTTNFAEICVEHLQKKGVNETAVVAAETGKPLTLLQFALQGFVKDFDVNNPAHVLQFFKNIHSESFKETLSALLKQGANPLHAGELGMSAIKMFSDIIKQIQTNYVLTEQPIKNLIFIVGAMLTKDRVDPEVIMELADEQLPYLPLRLYQWRELAKVLQENIVKDEVEMINKDPFGANPKLARKRKLLHIFKDIIFNREYPNLSALITQLGDTQFCQQLLRQILLSNDTANQVAHLLDRLTTLPLNEQQQTVVNNFKEKYRYLLLLFGEAFIAPKAEQVVDFVEALRICVDEPAVRQDAARVSETTSAQMTKPAARKALGQEISANTVAICANTFLKPTTQTTTTLAVLQSSVLPPQKESDSRGAQPEIVLSTTVPISKTIR